MKPLEEIAYEEYSIQSGTRPIIPFNDLPDIIKRAWYKTARIVSQHVISHQTHSDRNPFETTQIMNSCGPRL